MRVILLVCMTYFIYVAPDVSAQQQEQVKDPWVAFISSMVIVGGGQVYNGQVGKGGILLTGGIVGLGLAFSEADRPDSDKAMIGSGLFLGCFLWSVIDAPMTANRINREARQSSLYINPIIQDDLVGANLAYRF